MVELLGERKDLEDEYVIKEYLTDNGNVRILYLNNIKQSVTFTNKGQRNSLCDLYFELYDLPVVSNPNGNYYLVLGGGGFTYPKYYIAKYKDKKMDVVEINKKCVKYANQYFYLNDLVNKYDPKRQRLNIIIEDAIKYIEQTQNQYDYILIDLFNGAKMVKEIYQNEYIEKIKKILSKDGIIAINYAISNINKYTNKDELKNIIKQMKNYKIITKKEYFNQTIKTGNALILLSNNNIDILNGYEYIEISNILI